MRQYGRRRDGGTGPGYCREHGPRGGGGAGGHGGGHDTIQDQGGNRKGILMPKMQVDHFEGIHDESMEKVEGVPNFRQVAGLWE